MPPQPARPMVMRLDGAGRSERPSAVAGMIVGKAIVALATARNRRRLKEEFAGDLFMTAACSFGNASASSSLLWKPARMIGAAVVESFGQFTRALAVRVHDPDGWHFSSGSAAEHNMAAIGRFTDAKIPYRGLGVSERCN